MSLRNWKDRLTNSFSCLFFRCRKDGYLFLSIILVQIHSTQVPSRCTSFRNAKTGLIHSIIQHIFGKKENKITKYDSLHKILSSVINKFLNLSRETWWNLTNLTQIFWLCRQITSGIQSFYISVNTNRSKHKFSQTHDTSCHLINGFAKGHPHINRIKIFP